MNDARFPRNCLLILSLVLGISFFIHSQWGGADDLNPYGPMLIWSYLINFVLAFGIVVLLFALRNKMKTQLGFLFMGGSAIKFLLFFLVFYPAFTSDGTISRAEFASFFVPYFLSLIVETYFAAVLLKNLEKENPG